VVGALLASRNLPEDRPSGRARLDVVGLLLLSPGVAAVIFALSRVEAAGGTSRQVRLPKDGAPTRKGQRHCHHPAGTRGDQAQRARKHALLAHRRPLPEDLQRAGQPAELSVHRRTRMLPGG
jgi:hypothetical protein